MATERMEPGPADLQTASGEEGDEERRLAKRGIETEFAKSEHFKRQGAQRI